MNKKFPLETICKRFRNSSNWQYLFLFYG